MAVKRLNRSCAWRRTTTFAALALMASLQACATPQRVNSPDDASPDMATAGRSSVELLAMIDQADAAYGHGQWSDASSYYQRVLQQVPDDPYLWFRLGNTLTRQGLYSQAIYAFEASLQFDSQQAKPWFNLSTTYLLGAQLATLKAWEMTDQNDPSRTALNLRLDTLTQLLR